MIRSSLSALVLAAAGNTAHAALVVYDFQDFNGDILAASARPANLQASSATIINLYGGLCFNYDFGNTNNFACGGFGSSTLSFTVTADAGWQFDVNSFVFQGLGTDPVFGPTDYAVYSSLDGFTNALISGSLGWARPNSRSTTTTPG
jgi:hypothetical protein